MSKNAGKLYTISSFRNGGRRAGDGMLHGDYSEDSMGGCSVDRGTIKVTLPHDGVPPEDLNGPVRIIQPKKTTKMKRIDTYDL